MWDGTDGRSDDDGGREGGRHEGSGRSRRHAGERAARRAGGRGRSSIGRGARERVNPDCGCCCHDGRPRPLAHPPVPTSARTPARRGTRSLSERASSMGSCLRCAHCAAIAAAAAVVLLRVGDETTHCFGDSLAVSSSLPSSSCYRSSLCMCIYIHSTEEEGNQRGHNPLG